MISYIQHINPNSAYQLELWVWETDASIVNNTSVIHVDGYIVSRDSAYTAWNDNGSANTVTIDGAKYYPTTAYDTRNGNATQIFSYTKTVTHNNDGTKSVPISWSFNGNLSSYNPNGTINATFTCAKIARHGNITNTSGNINDEGTPWIEFTNPANGTTQVWLELPNATASGTRIAQRNNVGSRYTWTLTEAERDQIRQAMSEKSLTALNYVYANYVGGSWVERRVAAQMSIVNADPVFEAEYLDADTDTVAVTENDQVIVQNQSHLQIKVRLAEAYKFATLTTASTEILGQTYTANIVNGAATLDIGMVDTAQDFQPRVVVTDSRGKTNAANPEITVAAWQMPTAIMSVKRHNNYYSETDMKIDVDYAPVEGKNTLAIQARVKKTTDTAWSDYQTIPNNEAVVFDLDNNFAWDIQFLATDAFDSATFSTTVSRGMPIVFFDRRKSSTGFNCFPEHDHSVEIVDDLYVKSDATVTSNLDVQGYAHVGQSLVVEGAINAPGLTEHVLFEGDTHDSFTLSDDVSNYRYLKILHRCDNWAQHTSLIDCRYLSHDMKTTLTQTWVGANNGANWVHATTYKFSGTTVEQIRRLSTCMYTGGSIGYNDHGVYVVKVIGYKAAEGQ